MINYNKNKLDKAGRKHRLKFVILHGSVATGKNRQDSDLDIAVLGRQEVGLDKLMKMHGDFEEIFMKNQAGQFTDLDLKPLNRVDPFFRYEVIRDGQLLYGNATEFEEYKAYAFRDFMDSQDLRQLERRLIEKSRQHFKKYVK
ncbi:nucleotidyltransferase domain-containing protein [Candidatus Uhrbacteria bacterium]|nr:nucleotidyltransferase domain-containing protein [Candidatus Uhrbacteria bacterium]